jgi:hypothetical protein
MTLDQRQTRLCGAVAHLAAETSARNALGSFAHDKLLWEQSSVGRHPASICLAANKKGPPSGGPFLNS